MGGLSKNKDQQKEIDERAITTTGHYFDSTNKNVDASLQELLKSLQVKPEYPEAHFLAGLIYLGRAENGLLSLSNRDSLEAEYYAAHNNLGAAFLNEARWDDAIRFLRGL